MKKTKKKVLRGKRQPYKKLTEKQIVKILVATTRAKWGLKGPMAEKFGVNQSSLSYWRHRYARQLKAAL